MFSNPNIYWKITTAQVVHATNSCEHVTSYQNSTYSQCMPLELELKHTLVNPWQSTNLNMRVEWLNMQVEWLNMQIEWLNMRIEWLNMRVEWLNMRIEWLNTWISKESTRKIGTHSRFSARKHEIRNDLCRTMIKTTVI